MISSSLYNETKRSKIMFAAINLKVSLPNHNWLSFISCTYLLQKDELFITVGNIPFTFTSGCEDEDCRWGLQLFQGHIYILGDFLLLRWKQTAKAKRIFISLHVVSYLLPFQTLLLFSLEMLFTFQPNPLCLFPQASFLFFLSWG